MVECSALVSHIELEHRYDPETPSYKNTLMTFVEQRKIEFQPTRAFLLITPGVGIDKMTTAKRGVSL